ncbi:MAG: D-alanyl-D-alanine carboxypeptidase/D-alanyl-D-alanine-endopeptidase [Bacteroidetes bacterium]|nr:D-alanyl-D-alanine carboxypeptidase/D-alanyl-D-alanine-endopeptidase [Bacteroidota bacterium]
MVVFKNKLLCIFFFCFTKLFCQTALNNIVKTWQADPDLKTALLSYCVINLKTNSVVAEFNSHQSIIPASTLKVITTGAAIGILGNNYRFTTKIMYSGVFEKSTGIINGDLYIVGTGDPTLQSENFRKDSIQITDKWAVILKEKGVKEIKGKIIGDATYYDKNIPSNWIWGDINNYFGAAPCALNYSDNKFSINYNTSTIGTKANVVSTYPSYITNTLNIASNVIAKGTEDDAYVIGDPFNYTKQVEGKIPPNKKNYAVEAVLPDPALLCAEQLYLSLKKINIKCDIKKIESTYKFHDTIPKRDLLYTHYSPSLDKIIYFTNIKSINLYCEALLRAIGKGSTYVGIEAVKKYWQKNEIDVNELYMVDGSGLSRANTVTTYLQANILSKIYKDSLEYKSFFTSLPIAGKSGSMSNIGKKTQIENNMRAKTGYINRARGYCGFIKNNKENSLAFSVLFNNYNCGAKEAKQKIELFLISLFEVN